MNSDMCLEKDAEGSASFFFAYSGRNGRIDRRIGVQKMFHFHTNYVIILSNRVKVLDVGNPIRKEMNITNE